MNKNIWLRNELQKKWFRVFEENEERLTKDVAENDRIATFPYESFQWLIDTGYSKLTLPIEYGGEGADIYDLVVLQEKLATYDSALALCIGWHLNVVGGLFESSTLSQDLRDEIGRDVANGAIINRAISEKATGNPSREGKQTTIATRVGEQYIINGEKSFTTLCRVMTHVIIAVHIEGTEGTHHLYVPMNESGIEIHENWDVLSMRATESHDMSITNVAVNQRYVVGHELKVSQGPIRWLLHIPAVYIGIAQAARNYAVDFAATYQPNSVPKPIGYLPTVEQNIGRMETSIVTARHLLYSTADAYRYAEHPSEVQSERVLAKVVVSNQCIDAVDLAMRIVGAKSLELSRPLQRYYRDVRAGLCNPPPEDMTYREVARSVLNRHAEKELV